MPMVRTVLGDIAPSQMGVTLTHEHLMLSWGSVEKDLGPLFDRNAIVKQICDDLGQAVRNHGVKSVVDVTAPELGRDVDLMADVARRLNVNVVAATGFYRQWAGLPFYWSAHDAEHLEEHMAREITQGVGRSLIKCGVVKLAMSTAVLQPAEELAFRAAGRVQRKLGVPIVIHSSGWPAKESNAGPRAALDLLVSEGASPERIQISHCDGAAGDLTYLLELARRGCYLAFDNIGYRARPDVDQLRVAMVAGLVGAGYANRVHLSMDHQGAWVPKQPKRFVTINKSFSQMHKEFIPMLLKGGVSESVVQTITVENPRQLFGF